MPALMIGKKANADVENDYFPAMDGPAAPPPVLQEARQDLKLLDPSHFHIRTLSIF